MQSGGLKVTVGLPASHRQGLQDSSLGNERQAVLIASSGSRSEAKERRKVSGVFFLSLQFLPVNIGPVLKQLSLGENLMHFELCEIDNYLVDKSPC